MADETIEEQMAKLSDAELLLALNNTLAKRQTPPPPQETQATTDAAEYAEYEKFFGGTR